MADLVELAPQTVVRGAKLATAVSATTERKLRPLENLLLHKLYENDYNIKYTTPCPRKKQATFIFAITSPSVEIFVQFLKHFVRE